MSSVKGTSSLRRGVGKATASGAVDDEDFKSAFMTVSSLPIYSTRDLAEYITKIKDSLSANAEDWPKRVNGLKDLRNVIASGGQQIDDFPTLLRSLESPVGNCLQDLRSQVVREACITVAYASQEIGSKFDHFAEFIMPTLINLIPNSAKIMATSGITAINFIIRNTYASRVFPIIAGGLSSKSKEIRKYVCIFLDPIFQYWPVNVLERHMGLIQETLRKGVSDADQDARSATRKAFQSFAEKFPDHLETVLRNLEPAKRKMIERAICGAGDDQSSNASSRVGSQSNLAAAGSMRGPATAKRNATRPALGTGGLGTTGRKNTVASTTPWMAERTGRGLYGENRTRLGSAKTSMSQPASRDTSPSSRCGSEYGDYGDGGGGGGYGASSTVGRRQLYGANRRPSASGLGTASRRVPRSQGPSRDGSPNSAYGGGGGAIGGGGYGYGTARSAVSATGQRPSLSSMSDAGFSQFGRYYRQPTESDDNASETSSMCSERSGRSMPVHRRGFVRPINRFSVPRNIQGLGDILALLSSTQWAEKKDGLVHLKEFLASDQPMSHAEVVRVSESLSAMFGDSSSKVTAPFMEALQLFIRRYHQFLNDWIYFAMVRLFNRQGIDVMASHQRAISETLAVIRSHFPLNLQFACCCRFIIDDAMTPTLKVKVRVLEYLKDVLVMMPTDVINSPSPEVTKGITRVIAWSTEPKSADLRRLASRIVIKLSDLNPAAFAAIVQRMPKASQDQSAQLLKTYQKTSTAGATHDPNSPDAASPGSRLTRGQQSFGALRPFSPNAPSYGQPQYSPGGGQGSSLHNRSASIPDGRPVDVTPAGMYAGPTSPPRLPQSAHPLYSQLPTGQNGQAGPSPQNGGGGGAQSGHNFFPMAGNGGMGGGGGGGVGGHPYASPAAGDTGNGDPGFSSGGNHPAPSLLSGFTNEQMPPEDAISEILQELSNYNERYEQRKACMLKLIKLLRDGTVQTWEEHSKPTLLILLESLSDNSGETRALSLRVLQELVRTQSELISDYACLTVMKILEACNDPDKGVIRSAEECAQAVAKYLSQELSLRLLTTVINDNQTTLSLPAVKMQTQVIKVSPPEIVQEVLGELVPGLVAACSHEDSHMRKASIFCLVQIAVKFGDGVWEYLTDLNASKKRLLRIYIDKELEGGARSSESVRLSGNIPLR